MKTTLIFNALIANQLSSLVEGGVRNSTLPIFSNLTLYNAKKEILVMNILKMDTPLKTIFNGINPKTPLFVTNLKMIELSQAPNVSFLARPQMFSTHGYGGNFYTMGDLLQDNGITLKVF
jgi:hypothetical protein